MFLTSLFGTFKVTMNHTHSVIKNTRCNHPAVHSRRYTAGGTERLAMARPAGDGRAVASLSVYRRTSYSVPPAVYRRMITPCVFDDAVFVVHGDFTYVICFRMSVHRAKECNSLRLPRNPHWRVIPSTAPLLRTDNPHIFTEPQSSVVSVSATPSTAPLSRKAPSLHTAAGESPASLARAAQPSTHHSSRRAPGRGKEAIIEASMIEAGKGFLCKAPLCQKMKEHCFPSYPAIKKHFSEFHEPCVTLVRCYQCKKYFRFWSHFCRHRRLYHNGKAKGYAFTKDNIFYTSPGKMPPPEEWEPDRNMNTELRFRRHRLVKVLRAREGETGQLYTKATAPATAVGTAKSSVASAKLIAAGSKPGTSVSVSPVDAEEVRCPLGRGRGIANLISAGSKPGTSVSPVDAQEVQSVEVRRPLGRGRSIANLISAGSKPGTSVSPVDAEGVHRPAGRGKMIAMLIASGYRPGPPVFVSPDAAKDN